MFLGLKEAQRRKIEEFARFFVYQQGLFEEKEGYKNLAHTLGQRDGEWRVCSNKLFHIDTILSLQNQFL